MPVKIVRNDITKMKCDAIVNTANQYPRVGSGCDYAVYQAAGWEELLAFRRKIGAVEPGRAFITPGFRLPANYIIHAVSPRYLDGQSGEEEMLRSCYRECLRIAAKYGFCTLAFPLISTGSFGYPREEGLRIAIDEIKAFLLKEEMMIYLVVFDQESTRLGRRFYPDLESYIDEKYVGTVCRREYAEAPRPAERPVKSERRQPLFRRRSENQRDNRHQWDGQQNYNQQAARPQDDKSWNDTQWDRNQQAARPQNDNRQDDEATNYGWPECGHQSSEQDDAPRTGAVCGASFQEIPITGAAPLATDSFEKEQAFWERHEGALAERMKHMSDTFSEYLLYLIASKGMTNAEVYKRAIVDKKVFSKIKNNRNYHTQKITAMCLCVGAKLNMDETRDLLARAGYALSPCDKTDIIFSYFIENQIYDMIELDIQLEEHGLACLIS